MTLREGREEEKHIRLCHQLNWIFCALDFSLSPASQLAPGGDGQLLAGGTVAWSGPAAADETFMFVCKLQRNGLAAGSLARLQDGRMAARAGIVRKASLRS